MFVIKDCWECTLFINLVFKSKDDAIRWIEEYNKQWEPLTISENEEVLGFGVVFIQELKVWDGTWPK